MTLYELVKHLRVSILDDTGGTGISWQDITEDDETVNLLRWSNEELTRFINEAERQACRSSLLLKEASDDLDIELVEDVSTYTHSPRIINIKNAYLGSTNTELRRVEVEDLYQIPRWKSVVGVPNRYIVDYATKVIRFYPTPVSDDTVNIIAYTLPRREMDWVSRDIDTPEIKEQYHLPLLHYAAYLAYQKENANTFDPQRSEKFKLLFHSEFSDSSAYSETRRERTRYRPIKYGGY
jgi:hypothetical protein